MVTRKREMVGFGEGIYNIHDSSSQGKQSKPGNTLYFTYANNHPSHSCIEATLPFRGESSLYCIVHGGIEFIYKFGFTGTAVRGKLNTLVLASVFRI